MLIVPWSDVVLEVNKSYVISHVFKRFHFLLLSYMIHVQFNLFLRLKISSSAHVDKLSFATLAVQPLHSMFLMSPGQPFSEVLLRMRYIYLAFFAFGHIEAKWYNVVNVGTLTCEGLAVNQRGVTIPVVHVTISKYRTTMDLLYSWPYVPARTMRMTWVSGTNILELLIIEGSFPFQISVAYIQRGIFSEFYSTPLANPGHYLNG